MSPRQKKILVKFASLYEFFFVPKSILEVIITSIVETITYNYHNQLQSCHKSSFSETGSSLCRGLPSRMSNNQEG